MEPAVGEDSMSWDSAAALDLAIGRIVQALTPSQQDWDRRRTLVNEHVARLARQLNSPHPIQISTFGSSLSALCLTNSDLDLGLFGRMNGCPVVELKSKQQRSLLAQVMRALNAANLAQGKKIQAIWGARVPVLKYTCSLSGLDCDLSIQGSGALLKANFMYILNSHCQQLAPLYRLVKLWAQAHDLNDASRGTLNSTSLLYLTIFYLQQVHLLPPLQKLVPRELLQQPQTRLLQGGNQQVWDDPQRLTRLLTAVQGRMAAWVAGHQQQQLPGVGQLLLGFFQMWSGQLSDWVLGKNRDLHADLWHGTWTPGVFPKKYIFCLQDPFDASDCPARAVGSNTNTNGGTAAFIAYMFSSSSRVIQRYLDNCQSQSANGGRLSADGVGAAACWFDECGGSQSSAAAAASEAVPPIRIELCKVLAWLFGPQGLLLLGSFEQQQQQQLMHGYVAWAAAPFPHSLVAAVQQRQQQNLKPEKLLTWLVEQLGAQLSQEHNILTLQHIGLLLKQINTVATAAVQSRTPLNGMHEQSRQGVQDTDQQHLQQLDVDGIKEAAGSGANGGCAAAYEQAEHTATVVSPVQVSASAQQQQPVSRGVISDYSISSIPMEGPGLAQVDAVILQEQQHLSHRMAEFSTCYKHLQAGVSPKRCPKAVKKTVQQCLTAVAGWLLQLQQQEEADVTYGFLAVLEQHGFTGLLEGWGFLRDGVLWPQVLPESMVADSSSSLAAHVNSSGPTPVQHTAQPASNNARRVAAPIASVPASLAADHHSSSGDTELPTMKQLLGSNGKSYSLLRKLYNIVRTANQLQLEAAMAAGQDAKSPVLQQAVMAASVKNDPKTDTIVRKSAKGQQLCYATVDLPELVSLRRCLNGFLVSKQLIAPGTTLSHLLHRGSAAETDKKLAAKIIAKKALEWLWSKADVVLAVQKAVQLLEDQKGQQQGLGEAVHEALEKQQQQPVDRQACQSKSADASGQQSCSPNGHGTGAQQQRITPSEAATVAIATRAPDCCSVSNYVTVEGSSSAHNLLVPTCTQMGQQRQPQPTDPQLATGLDSVGDAFNSLSLSDRLNHADKKREVTSSTAPTVSTAHRTALDTAPPAVDHGISELAPLKRLLGYSGDACASLQKLYSCVRIANQLQLEAAKAAGYDLNMPVLQQAAVAASSDTQPRFDITLSKGAKGKKLQHAVVHLPGLIFCSRSPDGSPVLKQLICPGTTLSRLIKKGSAHEADKDLAAGYVAKKTLDWLGDKEDVVLAFQEALQVLEAQQGPGSGVGGAEVQGVSEQQQQQPSNSGQQGQSNPAGQHSCSSRALETGAQQPGSTKSAVAGTTATEVRTAPGSSPINNHRTAKGSSSCLSSGLLTPACTQGEQQQQFDGRQPTGGTANGVNAFTSMSLIASKDHTSEEQENDGRATGSHQAHAARTAFRNLRSVREQIQSLQQRITQKQEQLLQDEQKLETLLQEQHQTLLAASGGSNERTIMNFSTTETVGANGDLLLQLAMQQRVELARKNLKNSINSLKSRVNSNKQALQQFDISMQELKQKEASAAVALHEAEAACPAGSGSQCRQQ